MTAAPTVESRRRAVARGVGAGVSVGVLLLTLVVAAVTIVVPKAAGAVPLTVLSGSMSPALPVGSLVVVRPVDATDIRLGDVVTYLPHPDDPTSVTHRVVGIHHDQDGSRRFVLQGDANTAPDEPVAEHQVRGRVWYALPWLGHVNEVVNGGERTVVLYAVAAGFLAWAGTLWVGAYRARGREPGRAG